MTVMALQLSNRRYERFCREYIIDQNATAAYERAGFQRDDGNASRLFSQLEIQIRIAQLEHEVHVKLGSTAELVMEGLSRIAFADMRDFYDETGKLMQPQDWSDDMAMAVQEHEVCPISGRTEKIKLAPRRKSVV